MLKELFFLNPLATDCALSNEKQRSAIEVNFFGRYRRQRRRENRRREERIENREERERFILVIESGGRLSCRRQPKEESFQKRNE